MSTVHIELKKVQKWLFHVPRLRAMSGANVLLGEFMRRDLMTLAIQQSSWRLRGRAIGATAKTSIADPLGAGVDDPASDAQCGVIARDGGHFEAEFETGAEAFAREAARSLHERLPGLNFRIYVDDVEWSPARYRLSTDLPVLSPCEWTGRGLASISVRQGNDQAWVSLDVSARHGAARRAENSQKGTSSAFDSTTLLIEQTKLSGLKRPQTFEELAGSGYLALIHADGNGVGAAAGAVNADEREWFYHRNRVTLRRALASAINDVVDGATVPLLPLMIGGDDMLVVARAEVAHRFVVRMCRHIKDLQAEDRRPFELTLGIGVVVARPSIPIHRLHEVAERLASSAKRRYCATESAGPRSVIDWAVYTSSWVDDPEELRRRDWIVRSRPGHARDDRGRSAETRVLSRRPLDVLGKGLDSLEGLLAAGSKVKDLPRAPLHYMMQQLVRGRHLSETALLACPPNVLDKLRDAGIESETLWSPPPISTTSLLDLIEVVEIARMGRESSEGVDRESSISENGEEPIEYDR
jgi:hypothetical protein